jgi:tetratricopeptide (TPR) repeat protein
MVQSKSRFYCMLLTKTLLAAVTFVAILGWERQLKAEDAVATNHGRLEAISGLGRKLYALPDDGAITDAKASLAKDPHNVALVLQLSQAQAGQRQYQEAVATCTKAIAFAPKNADLYLERGHRELGLRRFLAARSDLEQAVALNSKSLEANYHLALSYYFTGNFDMAAKYFQRAIDLAQTPDSIIDCSNWLYVSLRREGQDDRAAVVLKKITPVIKNTEPHLYFYLQLLHFYQGLISEEAVMPPKPAVSSDTEHELSFDTTGYGVGNWHLYRHQPVQAASSFRSVVTGQAWNSWGFIGSETELVRMKEKPVTAGSL